MDHPPMMSGEWVNERVDNVLDQALTILDRLLAIVMHSGYPPLTAPLDAPALRRMTPEQLAILRATTAPEQLPELEAKLRATRLPREVEEG